MASILLYHALADEVRDDRLQVRPATLARHLDWCVELGYRLVPLGEALRLPNEPVVAVTFDDGLASLVEVIPILQDRGAEATAFVCPGMLGRENSWAGAGRMRERLLDAEEVLSLREEGLALGCHGWNHRPFVLRSEPDVAEDLARCRAWFEANTGAGPEVFAWPFGRYDLTGWTLVGGAYRWALGAGPSSFREPWQLDVPRFGAPEGIGREAFADWLEAHSFATEASHGGAFD